jgi:hypothetical protein
MAAVSDVYDRSRHLLGKTTRADDVVHSADGGVTGPSPVMASSSRTPAPAGTLKDMMLRRVVVTLAALLAAAG